MTLAVARIEGNTLTQIPRNSRNTVPENSSLRDSAYLLKVSNLTVKAERQNILEDVSFKVKEGTTLAIVGPNGAGKSTLFRALLNLMPYSGQIEWSRKVKIGYVPQRFSVTDIPISVGEFLAFKRTNDFEVVLEAVDLKGRQILQRRLNVLSGGEMQRVLIAWAIVDDPDVLLFDEPTASVDIGSEALVYQTLNKIEKQFGMTVLLISHEIDVIMRYSDNTLALNRGVTFFGESKSLSNPDLLAKIYGSGTLLERHEH